MKQKKEKTVPTAADRLKPTMSTERPWRYAFGWQNFALTAAAVTLIVTGCLLMLPEKDVRAEYGGRYAAAPGPGAFDARRIRTAPIPCFIGYVLMIPAIMIKRD